MSEYKRWQQLNEALGFPLGVKSATSLGISGGLAPLEEAKHKKKMDDEISIKPSDESDEDDDDLDGLPDEDMDDDDGDDMGSDKDIGGCNCDSPMPKDKDANIMMCKKCNKSMKKGMKKKMKESVFAGYEPDAFKAQPKIGTEDYRKQFFNSLHDHFANPSTKHWGGVNLEEEVLLEPKDDTFPTPQPGQVGYSPATRIGEDPNMLDKVPMADWEQAWSSIQEQLQALTAGLNEIKRK